MTREFTDFMNKTYPNGLNNKAAESWRQALNKIGLDDYVLQPARVTRDGKRALAAVISLCLTNINKTGAAMQSIVEFGDAYLAHVISRDELPQLFLDSYLGKFSGFPHLAVKVVA